MRIPSGLLLSCLLLAQCQWSTLKEGGGTEAEGLTGILVDEAGKPVPGARVKAYRADAEPAAKIAAEDLPSPAPLRKEAATAVDSAETDRDGRFSFPELKEGSYNLEGTFQSGDRTLAIFIALVVGGRDLGSETMRPPGSVRAEVRKDGIPLEGALCYVPGSSFLAVSDDSGICLITGVPPGEYGLRIRYHGLMTASLETVEVEGGKEAEAGGADLEHDPEFPPPSPKGVKAGFDSAMALVRISWRKVALSDLDGYMVFRRDIADGAPEALSPRIIRDTFFVDTLPARDAEDSTEFLYQVRALDSLSNAGQFSQPGRAKVRFPAAPRPIAPADGAANQPVDVTLSWTAVGSRFAGSASYSVYLDTLNPPERRVDSGLTQTFSPRQGLLNGRKYFWRVVTHLSQRGIPGPVASFTVREPQPENRSPNAPSSPTPSDKAVDQGPSIVFRWVGGDPDSADSVRYDLYVWPQDGARKRVAQDLRSPTHSLLDGLTAGKTYYWQVSATDGKDVKEGPIWSFTTRPMRKYDVHFPFDEGTGTVAFDRGTARLRAELKGGASWGRGVSGSALDADGRGGRAELADGSMMTGSATMTVEAWIRPDSGSAEGILPIASIWNAADSQAQAWRLELAPGGHPVFVVSAGGRIDQRIRGDKAATAGEWHHVAAVYAQDSAFLYLDGEKAYAGASLGSPLSSATAPLVIGAQPGADSASPASRPGLVDELRILQYAMSAVEAKSNYQRMPSLSGLVAHWKFDGDTRDATPLANHARPVKGEAYTADRQGRPGRALLFDGRSDYLDVGMGNGLDPAYLTVSAWVHPVESKRMLIVGKTNHTMDLDASYALSLELFQYPIMPRGHIKRNSMCASHTEPERVNGKAFPLQRWTHVALTWDGADFKVYIDGILSASAPGTPGGIDLCSKGTFRIGSWWTADPMYFSGAMDEVRVYNRALGPEEIRQVMEAD